MEQVQKSIDDFMTGKALDFMFQSWDVSAIPANKPILQGLSVILKENPTLSIKVHGIQAGKHAKSAHFSKTFAKDFPGEPDPFKANSDDAIARARATASMHALRSMGCTNEITCSSEIGKVKRIVFSINS